MELDEGPPDHANSTWGGDRGLARTCISNVSKSASFLNSPRHQVYPQGPETAGQLKKGTYRKKAGADSQALPTSTFSPGKMSRFFPSMALNL